MQGRRRQLGGGNRASTSYEGAPRLEMLPGQRFRRSIRPGFEATALCFRRHPLPALTSFNSARSVATLTRLQLKPIRIEPLRTAGRNCSRWQRVLSHPYAQASAHLKEPPPRLRRRCPAPATRSAIPAYCGTRSHVSPAGRRGRLDRRRVIPGWQRDAPAPSKRSAPSQKSGFRSPVSARRAAGCQRSVPARASSIASREHSRGCAVD